MTTGGDRPGFRTGVRLVHSPAWGPALVYPEGVLLVNDSAAAILRLCDGERTVDAVVALLGRQYAAVLAADVTTLLDDLVVRRLVVLDGTGHAAEPGAWPVGERPTGSVRLPAPMGMVAELTYRCPLQCTYCANPVDLLSYQDELTTDDWLRVLDQARSLGVLQVHLSGGEPLLRRDLPALVEGARSADMYTNLVTSGVPLNQAPLARLIDAGLDHVQLSFQDSEPAVADSIAGRAAHGRKLIAAGWIKAAGLPLTINVVLHRSNVDHILAIADLAADLRADRLELAHTQFYGWALRNQNGLMPTDEQVAVAELAAASARARYGDRMEFVYVAADYHSGRPKPCMSGWGRHQLVVTPNGDALPCLAAAQLPGPSVPNIHGSGLSEIWYDSELFNRFRGDDWMPMPCRTCDLKTVDFGGCRCQAFQLIGDPAATDPACELSPHHHLIRARRAPAIAGSVVPRRLR